MLNKPVIWESIWRRHIFRVVCTTIYHILKAVIISFSMVLTLSLITGKPILITYFIKHLPTELFWGNIGIYLYWNGSGCLTTSLLNLSTYFLYSQFPGLRCSVASPLDCSTPLIASRARSVGGPSEYFHRGLWLAIPYGDVIGQSIDWRGIAYDSSLWDGLFLSIKAVFPGLGFFSIIKIRRSWDRLILIMGILILARRYIPVETASWSMSHRIACKVSCILCMMGIQYFSWDVLMVKFGIVSFDYTKAFLCG